MNLYRLLHLALCTVVLAGCAGHSRGTSAPAATGQKGEGVPDFWIRPGYRVTIAADNLKNARFLETDGEGRIFLSRPQEGDILLLTDSDGDGVYESRTTFIEGRRTVHGMDFEDGWLWFSQTGSIHRARDTDGDGEADDVQTVIAEGDLPSGGGHWWRSLLVTSDHIYTSIGDSGNINDERESERQKVWRFNRDGSGKKLWSSGIRNTEKLRLRPGTSEVWGCDHGSDHFGRELGEQRGNQPVTDAYPPCELNHYRQGAFYGHPLLVGANIPRLEYQDEPDILALASKAVQPAWSFGAHWAPNGFAFLTQDYFPDHDGDMFVAFHGSWNSTTPVGYRVERVLFDDVTGQPYGSLAIVRTQGADNSTLARPVDCVEDKDGSILFSCDFTNRLYRISRVGE